ncbi:siderophore ferric iron reductase [Pleionea sp. CnH1-48]|uniref:siderophore ferric iron reductase n=1 Tax=Pleionea sp. CnH1-48 TaxID=2954494 RepID=UPI002097E41A|nr:siderophore ferric iron reductase [Pleionea sp. CnH1-48]MCO7224561.1 siderophore ferric iron reductase [Pleionea sp. CnH1-48]
MIHASNGRFESFVEAASQMHSALVYDADHAQERIFSDRDNSSQLQHLYNTLQSDFAHGGKAYWSMRCWQLLYWQPVFLSVASVHCCQGALKLESLEQRVMNNSVWGYSFAQPEITPLPEEQLIHKAGEQLRVLCEHLFEQLSQITKIKRLTAFRLVADGVLKALVRFHAISSNSSHENTMTLSHHWLSAMGLEDQSQLLLQESSGLVVQRKACCMHYLIDADDICGNCPKHRTTKVCRSH